MWLKKGSECIELCNEVQIAAFLTSGFEECTSPKKTAKAQEAVRTNRRVKKNENDKPTA